VDQPAVGARDVQRVLQERDQRFDVLTIGLRNPSITLPNPTYSGNVTDRSPSMMANF
jgi:hypothetical protein